MNRSFLCISAPLIVLLLSIGVLSGCGHDIEHKYGWGQYVLSIPAAPVVGFGSGQALQNRWKEGPDCKEPKWPGDGRCSGRRFFILDTVIGSTYLLNLGYRVAYPETSDNSVYFLYALVGSRLWQTYDALLAPISVGLPSGDLYVGCDPSRGGRCDPAIGFNYAIK